MANAAALLAQDDEHWPWVYEGNKCLKVMCEPIPNNRSFAREGTAWYCFMNGSIQDEVFEERDIYDRVFVKMGVCKGCLNAGPAGMQCKWCCDDPNASGACWFGAVREAVTQDENIATEINPSHIVSAMDGRVWKCDSAEMANHWGSTAQLECHENDTCWTWDGGHDAILSKEESVIPAQAAGTGGRPTPQAQPKKRKSLKTPPSKKKGPVKRSKVAKGKPKGQPKDDSSYDSDDDDEGHDGTPPKSSKKK